jgi:hypothetical protein
VWKVRRKPSPAGVHVSVAAGVRLGLGAADGVGEGTAEGDGDGEGDGVGDSLGDGGAVDGASARNSAADSGDVRAGDAAINTDRMPSQEILTVIAVASAHAPKKARRRRTRPILPQPLP